MSRTRGVALIMAMSAAATAIGVNLWPDDGAKLDCPPEAVHLDERRVARCGPGEPLPVGQALTVGQTVDLNHVSAAELALIPGISGELARRLVDERARRGGFRSWNEVDEIEGVGLARLDRLQQHCRLQMTDSGV